MFMWLYIKKEKAKSCTTGMISCNSCYNITVHLFGGCVQPFSGIFETTPTVGKTWHVKKNSEINSIT